MAGETLNPPKELEETLVTDGDERFDASVTPVLPVELDTALDTFLSTLDLEDTTSMDFAISSSLSEALETGHDAEALISVVEQLEPQQVVELLASIDNPSDVPDTVTMNSLLSGDPNSQAAQFILENLAKQCASGAFITMQATMRNGETQEQKKKFERAQTLAAAIELANSINDLSTVGFKSYDAASNDEERQQAFDGTVDSMVDAWKAENPDATPEQIAYMRDHYSKLHESKIMQEYMQQVQSGEMTPAEFKEKLATLEDELAQHPELRDVYDGFNEVNQNLVAAQESLAAAQAAAAQGDHNAHVVTYYQGEVDRLLQAQADKVAELTEIRQRLIAENAELSEMSLEMLDARIQQEQEALTQLEALNTQIDGLTQKAEELDADIQDLEAEVSTATFELSMAKMTNFTDGMSHNSALGHLSNVVDDLEEQGFATIRVKVTSIGVIPESASGNESRLFGIDFSLTSDADAAQEHVILKDEEGQYFIETGDGQRHVLEGWMLSHAKTGPGGLEAARFVSSGAELAEYHEASLAVQATTAAVAESAADVLTKEARVESLQTLAGSRRAEFDQLVAERDQAQQQVDLYKSLGLDTTAAQEKLDALNIRTESMSQGLNQVDSFLSAYGQITPAPTSADSDFTLDLNNSSTSEFTLFDTGATSTTNTSDFGLTDFSLSTADLSLSDPLVSDFDFNLSSYEYTPLSLNYDFTTLDTSTISLDDDLLWADFSAAETFLTDFDIAPLSTGYTSIEADLEAQLNDLKIELLTDAGVPAELHEAFIKDMEHSLLSGTCAVNTNIGDQLGTNGPMSTDGGLSSNFGLNSFNEESMEAFRLTYAAENFAFTPEGERYKQILEELNELKGITTEQAIASNAATSEGAEALTLEGATSEAEMTESFRMHQDALAYIEQFGSNGYDDIHAYLEDKFDREIPQAEMDTLVAKIENDDGIEIAPSTLLESTAEEKPEEQELEVASVSPAVRNDFDHSAFTPA